MSREDSLNKAETIERCIKRINEEFDEEEFDLNYTIQDSIVLNLQRACEAAIDMGTGLVKIQKIKIPQKSRDVFLLLEEKKIISKGLSSSMQKMVGFRNIAVHDYSKLNLEIIKNIIKKHLSDFLNFSKTLLKSI